MPSLVDVAIAVWNHPQGKAAIISAFVSIPLYYNTPATRDLLQRLLPAIGVTVAIGLACLPSGTVKALRKEVDELRAEIKRIKGARRRK